MASRYLLDHKSPDQTELTQTHSNSKQGLPLKLKTLPISTRRTGLLQESNALKLLQRNGYRCIARNFLCRYGEIDLIVTLEKKILVFIEVRYRRSGEFGNPAETITWRKQARIKRSASCFLLQHKKFATFSCRFDVIAIYPQDDSGDEKVDWIKNAFH